MSEISSMSNQDSISCPQSYVIFAAAWEILSARVSLIVRDSWGAPEMELYPSDEL